MQKKQRNYLVLGAVVIVAALLYTGTVNLSILPGFEGEQGGLYGYQPNNEAVATVGNSIPTPPGSCGYSWAGTPTTAEASVTAQTAETFFGLLQPCAFETTSDMLNIAVATNPALENKPETVNYGVPVPGSTDKVQYVTGTVLNYTFTISLQIQATSSGAWSFSGDTIWFNLAALGWDRAIPDPNNASVSGPVFETPLYAVVEGVQWKYAADTTCSLCTRGDALDFYSSPSTSGQTVVTLTDNAPPTSSLNSSLSSIYSPDSRMQSLVYYPLTITHIENDCYLGTCDPPSALITIHLYTLQIGEFLLTNPDRTQLQLPSGSTCVGFLCGLQTFLSNPLAGLQNAIANAVANLEEFVVVGMIVLIVYAYVTRKKRGRNQTS